MKSREDFDVNESLPEVVNEAEILNERVIEKSEPIDDDDEIDFEAYGHMKETLFNEPHFEYVFKNEPEIEPKVEPVLSIDIDALEKFVVCVSADGAFTFAKVKKFEINAHLPVENNNQPSENEECSLHFETEIKEAAKTPSGEGELNLSAQTLKQEAKEESVKHVEPSSIKSDKVPGRRSKTILKNVRFNLSTNTVKQGARDVELSSNESDETGRRANTKFENDKLSLSTNTVTQEKQREKNISAKHVELCSNEFDEILSRRAVVVLERCVLPSLSGTPMKCCKTNGVTKPSEKHFSPKTNSESQKTIAQKLTKSELSNSAVDARNLKISESFFSISKRRIVERQKNSDWWRFGQRKRIDPERLRKPRAFLSSSKALKNNLSCKIANKVSFRSSDQQFSPETGGIEQENLTPKELQLRNLRRSKRNEMAKQRQKSSLSVRRAVMRLRERRNFLSSSEASKNRNCEIHDKKVECENRFSTETNQEKSSDEGRNLRQIKETAKQLEERFSSDNESRIARTNSVRKPGTFPSSSGTADKNDGNIAGSFPLQGDEHVSSKTENGSQKKFRIEAGNLRRSRRYETAQPHERRSSFDIVERRIVGRLRKPCTLPSSSETAKNHCKIDGENNLSLVVECDKLCLPEIRKEKKKMLRAEVKNLRRSRRNETAQKLEEGSSADGDERIIVKRLREARSLSPSSGTAKGHCNIDLEHTLTLECQEKLRADVNNLRRSRRHEIAKQVDESSSPDNGRKRARGRPRTKNSLSGTSEINNSFSLLQDDKHFLPETERESQEQIMEKPEKFELTAEAKSLSRICKRLEVRCIRLSDVESRIARMREDAAERTRSNKAKETPQRHAERRAAGRSANRNWQEKEHPDEREKLIADRHSHYEKCAANETPEQFELLNKDDILLDDNGSKRCDIPAIIGNENGLGDECCSSDDERITTRRRAKGIQIKVSASVKPIDCEDHFSPEISKENPEKATKTPEEYAIRVSNLALFKANNASKLDENYSSNEEAKRRKKPCELLPSMSETQTKILNEHSYSLETRVVRFPHKIAKQKDVTEESRLSVDKKIDVERRTSPHALDSVYETPTKRYRTIDEEHRYSLDKRKMPELTEIETIDQRENLAISDEARKEIVNRAMETPEQRARRRLLTSYRERNKRAQETPEEREKRRASARQRTKESRAKLQANKVKKVEINAREIASKRIIKNGKRKREELAAQRDAIDISKIQQRRAVVVLERCNLSSLFEAPKIDVENHSDNSLSLEREKFSAETRRKFQAEETQVSEECRIRRDDRNLRPVSCIKTVKRLLVKCHSSDNYEEMCNRSKDDAVGIMPMKIVRITPEELAKHLTTETFSVTLAEESEKDLTAENLDVRIDDKLETSVTQAKESEKDLTSENLDVRFADKLETNETQEAEEIEKDLTSENLVMRMDEELETSEIHAEESENVDVRIDEKLETPEKKLEELRTAYKLAYREWMKNFTDKEQKNLLTIEECLSGKEETAEERETRVVNETLAFRRWREENPGTNLYSYLVKYFAKITGSANKMPEEERAQRVEYESERCKKRGERFKLEKRSRLSSEQDEKSEKQTERNWRKREDYYADMLERQRQRRANRSQKQRRQMDRSSAVRRRQGKCNEPPNTTSEHGTICSDIRDANDKAVTEIFDSYCSQSCDTADGELSVCSNSCETNNQVDAETLTNNNCSINFVDAEAGNEDHVVTFSECLNSDNPSNQVEKLADSNSGHVEGEDGTERLVNLSLNIVASQEDIDVGNVLGPSDDDRAVETVPTTFYIINEDGTSSEIVLVYIDGDATA